MPISARRQLNELPDEVWTKIGIEFYMDSADAVFKAGRSRFNCPMLSVLYFT